VVRERILALLAFFHKVMFTAATGGQFRNSGMDARRSFDATALTISSVTTEGPDGGMVMRTWTGSSSYGMIGTANMTSAEYALMTDGTDTYISAGSGGSVYLRGGENDTAPQV
jgi:hypothetical protein